MFRRLVVMRCYLLAGELYKSLYGLVNRYRLSGGGDCLGKFRQVVQEAIGGLQWIHHGYCFAMIERIVCLAGSVPVVYGGKARGVRVNTFIIVKRDTGMLLKSLSF